DHETTTDLELRAKAFRNLRSPCGHDDGVERRRIGPAQGAVAMEHVDIAIAEADEPPLRHLGERAVALDRVDLPGDAGKHGGGVAGTGAYLKDTGPGFHL